MRYRILLFFLIAFHYQSLACSCGGYNSIFCGSVNNDHYIVHAVVGDSINHYTMSVYILENIYNEITEDTIYVIGHDGVNCGQILNVFETGDTVIFALSIYEDNGKMDWYLNGLCDLHYLRYENGLINGTIMSDTISNQTLQEFKDNMSNCIDLRVSTQNIPVHLNLEVYPNPATNIVNISISDHSLIGIELINTRGKIVATEKIANRYTHQIDMGNLDQGIYVLKIYSSAGIVSRKIVKL